MSPDEILELLVREFEKCVSSKDVHIPLHSFSSFGQVTSPIFDVEKDIEFERSLSNIGGAYNNTSDVYAHDDLINARDVFEGNFSTVSMFSHAGDCSVISFDPLDEEEQIENNVVDFEFPFITDNSCNKTSNDFNVPSNSLLDEDKDCDQQFLDQHF